MLSRFHTIGYQRVTDGQTDGQTDRRTDGQNCYRPISDAR